LIAMRMLGLDVCEVAGEAARRSPKQVAVLVRLLKPDIDNESPASDL